MITKLLKNKILSLISLLTFLMLFLIAIKIIRSHDYISGFYKNYFIYIFIFFLINTIIIIQKSNEVKKTYKILLMSTVFSLYTVEIYLNFIKKPFTAIEDLNFRKEQADKLGLPFDTRTKYEVYLDLKNKGEKVVPTIPPNDVFHKTKIFLNQISSPIYPLSSISNTKTVFCNESGKRTIYYSDKYGFRNKNEIWDQKEVDIVILGDSLVHGACVDDEHVISNQLSILTGKKVLNLGIQGHGPLMQIGALREYAASKRPKIILWYYSEANDLSNMVYEMSVDKINRYINKDYSQELMKNQKIIDEQLYKLLKLVAPNQAGDVKENLGTINYTGLIKLYKIRDFLTHFFPVDKALISYRYAPVDTLNEYFKLIKIAKEITEEWGGEFYFVYHPHLTRYIGTYSLQYGQRQYGYFIKKLNEMKINTIDLKKELFDTAGGPKKLYHFGIPGHPSENGYKLTAEHFAKILF